MTKKIKRIAVLIIVAIVSLIMIQTFYSEKEYQSQKKQFQKEVSITLEEVVRKTERIKKDSLLSLFEQDVKDTNLIKIQYDLYNDVRPLITVFDVEKGKKDMTLHFDENSEEFALTEEYFFQNFVQKSREIIDRENSFQFFLLARPIVRRIEEHRASIPYDMSYLQSELDKELAFKGIKHDYSFITFLPDSTDGYGAELKALKTINDTTTAVFSDLISFKEKPKTGVLVIYPEPMFDILQRMWLNLLSSLALLIVLIYGFYQLFKIISQQKKLSEMKDDFMDNMSHELLTPISTMGVALESLEKYNALAEKAKSEKYVKMSQLELQGISDIVHNVLLTSQHEKRNFTLKIEDLNLGNLVQKVADYHLARSENSIELTIDQADNSLLVKVDEQHLFNAINNLVENAIKYNENEKPKISILISSTSDAAQLLVKDNGTGISESEWKLIFTKFHRAHKGNVKGLGIGLYYAKNILQEMGGNLKIVESSTKGSTFQILMKK